jgi:ABC-type uncharacterized transport system permease subunit
MAQATTKSFSPTESPVLLASLVALLVGSFLCVLYGESPARIFSALLSKTWGDAYGIGQVLYKATMLSFTGISVAVAFRAGLFNVGVEGQLLLGGFAAAVVGAWLSPSMPGIVVMLFSLLAGAAAGALWALLPAILRAYRGAHEVISTIMLNFLAASLVNYLLTEGGFAVEESVHTKPVAAGAMLSRLSAYISPFSGSAANTSILLAAIVAVLYWFIFAKTRLGYQLKSFGLSPEAAVTNGISASRMIIIAMLLSGAVAGLGSINFVLGYRGYFEENFSAGIGFLGIAVALVARNSPSMIPVAALLFATLSQGGLAINARIPKDLIDILQGVIIIAVIAARETLGNKKG